VIESATPYSGAVALVHIKGGGKTVFVVATSGKPDGLEEVFGPGQQATLGARVQGRLGKPCTFLYANSAYDFYLPMNADFLDLFKAVTSGFNPPTQWLATADVTKKLNDLQALVEGKQMAKDQPALAKGYRSKHELPVRQMVGQNERNQAVKDIATIALALHMNACGKEQTFIRAYFDLTLLLLDLHALIIAKHWGTEAKWVQSFIACASALAKKTQDNEVDLTPFLTDLEPQTRTAFKKYVVMKANSLFCAEPRAFAALSKNICSVSGIPVSLVVSQTCFWSAGNGKACPPDYIVEGTMHGASCYMWPCKSCHARSSFMMAGLNAAPKTEKRTSFESPL